MRCGGWDLNPRTPEGRDVLALSWPVILSPAPLARLGHPRVSMQSHERLDNLFASTCPIVPNILLTR